MGGRKVDVIAGILLPPVNHDLTARRVRTLPIRGEDFQARLRWCCQPGNQGDNRRNLARVVVWHALTIKPLRSRVHVVVRVIGFGQSLIRLGIVGRRLAVGDEVAVPSEGAGCSRDNEIARHVPSILRLVVDGKLSIVEKAWYGDVIHRRTVARNLLS